MKTLLLILLPLLAGGCIGPRGLAPVIRELARDPATIHLVIHAPGWDLTLDRANTNAVPSK